MTEIRHYVSPAGAMFSTSGYPNWQISGRKP
jgi:hypothetical protein